MPVDDRRPDDRRPIDAPAWRALGGWLGLGAIVAVSLSMVGAFDLFAAQPAAAQAQGLPAASGPAGSPGAGGDASGGVGSGAGVVDAGRGLYTAQCASCHGVNGEGGPYGPSLVGSGAAGADFYMRTGRMPLSAPGQPVARHEPRLTDEEIRQLVDVVAGFGAGPEIPQVQGGGDVGEGAELYIANCAACHGATGAGNAIGGGSNAASLAHATPVQIVEALRIGPGSMPRFVLTPEDESAIVAYVQVLQNEPSPGGASIGGFGAVAEGFVAIAIGLTFLVLVAMFVGRRSHEGEPPAGRLP
jgi:ubiquinol-cytochrome c reductase cytochrome c subunit